MKISCTQPNLQIMNDHSIKNIGGDPMKYCGGEAQIFDDKPIRGGVSPTPPTN